MSDPEDYRSVFPVAENERPSPVALAVSGHAMTRKPSDPHVLGSDDPATERTPLAVVALLWAASAVLVMLGIALLLAGVSMLIGGHPWWLR